jgi:nitrogen fixation/metabolism regulation signal transduction histidine kinase
MMMVMLPNKIVRPITLLNQILKKAGTGDFTTEETIYTHDEIGDLAANYNQVLSKLRLYDELKSKKIASQKRIIERLLENIPIPVCIVTSNLNALFYNLAFAMIFGPSVPQKPPEGGLELESIETMKIFSEKISEKVYSTTTEFYLDVTDRDGKIVKLKGRLVRNSIMELESIVMVGVSTGA